MLKTFLHLFFCTKFLKPAYFNYVALHVYGALQLGFLRVSAWFYDILKMRNVPQKV